MSWEWIPTPLPEAPYCGWTAESLPAPYCVLPPGHPEPFHQLQPPMTLGWLASPDDELIPAKSRPLPYVDDDTIGDFSALVLPEESTPE